MKCTDCKYCIQMEYGYSNYTVEGTTADCLLKQNPKMPVDRGCGLDPVLDFAAQCAKFTKGEGVYVDVESVGGALENYTDDEELKELLRKY